jgi:prepilin-type N-terminal cleavage/methylation domain-containing protein
MTSKNKGFTLIEIIIVLVVTGFVAAIMIPFLGSALTRSHEPLENLRRASGLSSDMARVVASWDEIKGDCQGSNNFIDCIVGAVEDLDLQNSELDEEETKLVMFQKNNDDDYSEKDYSDTVNDPEGCENPQGSSNVCTDLKPGWRCTDQRGNSCHAWVRDAASILKVRLKGSLNPGEILTYYFPYPSE